MDILFRIEKAFPRNQLGVIGIYSLTVNVVDGENLTISKVSRLHMGAYLCIASNGVPPSISKRVVLMVQCEFPFIFHLKRKVFFDLQIIKITDYR